MSVIWVKDKMNAAMHRARPWPETETHFGYSIPRLFLSFLVFSINTTPEKISSENPAAFFGRGLGNRPLNTRFRLFPWPGSQIFTNDYDDYLTTLRTDNHDSLAS